MRQTFYWYGRGQLFIYRNVTMFTDVLTDYTAGDNDGWFWLLEDSVVNLISLQLYGQ
jgi:hypothetical protein